MMYFHLPDILKIHRPSFQVSRSLSVISCHRVLPNPHSSTSRLLSSFLFVLPSFGPCALLVQIIWTCKRVVHLIRGSINVTRGLFLPETNVKRCHSRVPTFGVPTRAKATFIVVWDSISLWQANGYSARFGSYLVFLKVRLLVFSFERLLTLSLARTGLLIVLFLQILIILISDHPGRWIHFLENK